MSFSNTHIDYLTRKYLESTQDPNDIQFSHSKSISFIKVSSIPRLWDRKNRIISHSRELMQDLILGLRGMMMPLIFVLLGEKDKVSIFAGTYVNITNSSNEQVAVDTLSSVLVSAYPGIEFEEEKKPNGETGIRIFRDSDVKSKLSSYANVAIMTGLPTSKVGEEHNETEQIDRLIRGLYGREWAYIQVAEPVSPNVVNESYNQVLMEFKNILDAEARIKMKNPVADRYQELLEKYLKKLEEAKAQGAWNVCSYLSSSEPIVLGQECGIAESVFGGTDSVLDPVRTLRCSMSITSSNSLELILTPGPRGPGNIQHKYKYMRMMPSPDLATLIHLPTLEMPGFWVKSYTRFDVYPQNKKGSLVDIGEILDETRPMHSQYQVSQKDLNKHCLIVGTTGSGKTNTVFYMLRQLCKMGIPFLVIEPAKTEYRKLINSEDMGPEMQVFTLGDEGTSPFRLNPFEILPGVSLQTHIDHLKSVFGASFPMWAPMPQVLEKSIHEIYQDKGWLLVENINQRGRSLDSFPTLTDLYTKVEEVVRELGYEERVTMDVQAALKTRIDSLRIGGKGLMLDVRKGVPFEKLMGRPTIIELEAVADDDEKAMLMGLILVFLQEHYQSLGLGEDTPLKHVTVVEEAHRLLSNVGKGLESEVANTRWKAVETFTNMLSELRAYGEGFIIAEQIPMKLSPDVIKNTNTKIMHRVVSEEDRRVVGGSMNLDEKGSKKATSLTVGQAIVFGEGDDSPFHVKVPYAKIKSDKIEGNDKQLVTKHMKNFWEDLPDVYTPFDNCRKFCQSICSYRSLGRKIAEDPAFQETMNRFVLTTLEDPGLFFQGYKELKSKSKETSLREDDIQGILVCSFIQASQRYFERIGSLYRWDYSDVSQLKDLFTGALCETITQDEEITSVIQTPQQQDAFISDLAKGLESLQNIYKESTFGRQPYMDLCPRICLDGTCIYRYGVKELLLKPGLIERLVRVIDESTEELIELNSLSEARKTVRRIISTEENDSIMRAALCYLLHTAMEIWPNEMFEVTRFIDKILDIGDINNMGIRG